MLTTTEFEMTVTEKKKCLNELVYIKKKMRSELEVFN